MSTAIDSPDIITAQPNEQSSQSAMLPPNLPGTAPQINQELGPLGWARSPGIASLVLGIISIPFACCVLGIIGLALANYSLQTTPAGANNRFARVGRICSIIGIVLTVVVIATIVIWIARQNNQKPMVF